MVSKINRQMHLVVPVYSGDDEERVVYVHSAPIGIEVFQTFYDVMARTFSELFLDKIGDWAGPRVAAYKLRDVARNMKRLEGPGGVELGLIEEIKRLTSVIAPTERGWEPIPLREGLTREFIDAEDMDEIENAIVYFTVAWRMHKRSERQAILKDAATLWGAQLSPLNSTEYANSLKMSIEPANSGPTPTAGSSVPY